MANKIEKTVTVSENKAPANKEAQTAANAEAQAPANAEAQAPANAEAQAPANAEAQAPVKGEIKGSEIAQILSNPFKGLEDKVKDLGEKISKSKDEAVLLFAAPTKDFAKIGAAVKEIEVFETALREAQASLDAAKFGPTLMGIVSEAVKNGSLRVPSLPHLLMQISFIGGEVRTCAPVNTTSVAAKISNAVANPAAAPLVRAASAALGTTSADARHAPAGWWRMKNCGGQEWQIVSLGAGQYRAQSGNQVVQGSGNKVGSQITGKACNCYAWMDLGGEGESFSGEIRKHWSPPKEGV